MTRRLCLVIPTLDRGGAEKQLCLLAAGLPKDKWDTHVVLLTRDGPRRAMLDAAEIPVTLIGKRFQADPTAYLRLKRYLRQLRPDIVHTWIFAANSYGRAAAHAVGVPTIIGSERCVDLWKTTRHFAIDRYLARRSAAITTNSCGVRDFYAQHGISADLFRIIPNGIEPQAHATISREEACRRLSVDANRRLVFAVGRLWPQKRYRDLIWGGEMLGLMRGDTTLVIIGEGPQRSELMRYRDAVTDSQRVCFAGQRSDVGSLLPHADVFWIGSEYEGQSNSVMEAMLAGLPVVASDIPGNRDLVLHDQTGWIVPLGDAAAFAQSTNTILNDADLADRLGQAGRQRISREFTVQHMLDGHQQLYNELISGNYKPGKSRS